MSLKLMTAVWESDVQPVAKRMVLLAIADSANDEGACWPHMATIARKSGVSLSTARNACALLEQEGLLEREYRKTVTAAGNETNKSSIYQINVEKLAARALDTSTENRPTPTGNRRPPTENERTPPPGTGGPSTENRRHNRKGNPQVEPPLNQSAAEGDAAPADGLFPAEESKPEINGGTIVAAYVDSYRAAHQGHDPIQADVRKVAGAAARLLKDKAVKPHLVVQAATAMGRTQFTDLAGQYRRSLQGSNTQDPTRGYYRAEQKNTFVPPAGETVEEANARVDAHMEWLKRYNAGTATLADKPRS